MTCKTTVTVNTCWGKKPGIRVQLHREKPPTPSNKLDYSYGETPIPWKYTDDNGQATFDLEPGMYWAWMEYKQTRTHARIGVVPEDADTCELLAVC